MVTRTSTTICSIRNGRKDKRHARLLGSDLDGSRSRIRMLLRRRIRMRRWIRHIARWVSCWVRRFLRNPTVRKRSLTVAVLLECLWHNLQMAASELFSICNAMVLPGWLLLVIAPRWRWTQGIAAVGIPLVPAAVYL